MDLKELARVVAMSRNQRSNHVALVTRKNRLIAVGVNTDKTHPIAKNLKRARQAETQCAELNAALKIGLSHRDGVYDFSDMVMTVVRVGKDGKLMMSKPCIGCQKMLAQCGFKRVMYSNSVGEIVKL